MLNHNVAWRGTFFRAFYFASQLSRLGHEVTVITTSPRSRARIQHEVRDGVHLVLMPDLTWGMARTGWDPWNVIRRIVYMSGNRFDLVHAFDSRPAVIHPARAYSRATGAPVVLDWADWWGAGGITSQRNNFFLRHIFSHIEVFYEEAFRTRAQWTTVISNRLADRARTLGVPAERITILPVGSALDYFAPIRTEVARERLSLPIEAKILTFAGFVQWDLGYVLTSFSHVALSNPKTLLVLCGPKVALTSLWKEANPRLADRVIEAGIVAISDMPTYLAAADALLMPLADTVANRARIPNKLGDYLAMGKAVVSNPTGDAGDLLRRTGAGVLATSEDPVEFADAITDLLVDPDRMDELGRRARRVAEDELDYRLLTRRLVEIYENI